MALFPAQMLREQLQIAAYGAGPSSPGAENVQDADDFGRKAFEVKDLDAFKSGLQRTPLSEDPNDPNSEKAQREKTASGAQDLYDAYTSFAHQQEWLSSEHTLGNITMTGAEFAALADRLKKDPAFSAAVKKGLTDRGYTDEQADKAIKDYDLWVRLSQITEKERIAKGLQDDYERVSKSPAVADVAEEAKVEVERQQDIGVQEEARVGVSWNNSADDLNALDSSRGSFAAAANSTPSAHGTAAQRPAEDPAPTGQPSDTVAQNRAQKTQTQELGFS